MTKKHSLIKSFNRYSDKRYLVVCRASDHSQHKQWVTPVEHKNFDLLLEYYGDNHGAYQNDCDIYSEAKGIKWNRIYQLMRDYKDYFFQYDAVWFPDDDIGTNSENINNMFRIFSDYKLEMAQCALEADSHIVWPIEKVDSKYILRYVNFVHAMAPVFSKDALKKCWETFGKCSTGYGVDFIWPKILGFPKDKLAIIDAAPVRHTRVRGGGTLLGDCVKEGVDPHHEYLMLDKEFGIQLYHPATLGGFYNQPRIGGLD